MVITSTIILREKPKFDKGPEHSGLTVHELCSNDQGGTERVVTAHDRSFWEAALKKGPFSAAHIFCSRLNGDVSGVVAQFQAGHTRSIALHVEACDQATINAVDRLDVSLLPALCPHKYIGKTTQQALSKKINAGERIVCRTLVPDEDEKTGQDPTGGSLVNVIRMIRADSANDRQPMSCVIALPRTGSQALSDLLTFSLPIGVPTYHEHELYTKPKTPDRGNRQNKKSARKVLLRQDFTKAPRRYIFSPQREPLDRLVSYYAKIHHRTLRENWDPDKRKFHDLAEVERGFHRWVEGQLPVLKKWYHTHIDGALRDVSKHELCRRAAEWQQHGIIVLQPDDATTLVLTRTEQLNDHIDQVRQIFGTDNIPIPARNEPADLGYGELYKVYRRSVGVPKQAAEAIFAIPTVHFLHGTASSTA